MTTKTKEKRSKSDDTRTLDFVKKVLAVDNLSDSYQVKMTPAEAIEFVRRAPEYNSISRANLEILITKIGHLVPKMDFGPDNVNTGQPFHYFYIGNEGSRVIYFAFWKSYWDKADFAKLNESLALLGKGTGADEYDDFSEKFEYKFRFWWD